VSGLLPQCPRCGAPYKGLRVKRVSGRDYIYAYHGRQDGRQVLCYVGPVGGYQHAEALLSLGLTNLDELNLIAVAYNAAALYAVRMRRRGEAAEAAERLRRLAEDIALLARDLSTRSLDEEERGEEDGAG